MQGRVRALFQDLFARLPTINVKRIDAGGSIQDVSAKVRAEFTTFVDAAALDSPPPKLQALMT